MESNIVENNGWRMSVCFTPSGVLALPCQGLMLLLSALWYQTAGWWAAGGKQVTEVKMVQGRCWTKLGKFSYSSFPSQR